MLVYCPEFTNKSKLAPDYLKDINEICFRDYRRAYFPEALLCLDLDAYEASRSGNNDATMDAATGIADYKNNHKASPRHLLVELRFGYKSTQNFDLNNMKRKVAHSRSILSPERIYERVAFIYTKEVAPRARSIFSRLAKADHDLETWDAMDIEGFRNNVLEATQLPYQPENNLEEIVDAINKKHTEGGLEALDVFLKYWIEKMHQYNLRYKHAESDAVAQVIVEALQALVMENSFEKEYLDLRIDEFKSFIQQ